MKLTDEGLRQLGGTTAVAVLVKAPVSTVHSWKRNGISASRLDHLRLAAKEAGLAIDWAQAIEGADGDLVLIDDALPMADTPTPEWPLGAADNGGEIISSDPEAESLHPFPSGPGPAASGPASPAASPPTSSRTCPTSAGAATPTNPRPSSAGASSEPEAEAA
jgi:hypothetical protein